MFFSLRPEECVFNDYNVFVLKLHSSAMTVFCKLQWLICSAACRSKNCLPKQTITLGLCSHIPQNKRFYIAYPQHPHTADSLKSLTATLFQSELVCRDTILPVSLYGRTNPTCVTSKSTGVFLIFAKLGSVHAKVEQKRSTECGRQSWPRSRHLRSARAGLFPEPERKWQKPHTQRLSGAQTVDRADELTSPWVTWVWPKARCSYSPFRS